MPLLGIAPRLCSCTVSVDKHTCNLVPTCSVTNPYKGSCCIVSRAYGIPQSPKDCATAAVRPSLTSPPSPPTNTHVFVNDSNWLQHLYLHAKPGLPVEETSARAAAQRLPHKSGFGQTCIVHSPGLGHQLVVSLPMPCQPHTCLAPAWPYDT
jgi:hypothetical protein